MLLLALLVACDLQGMDAHEAPAPPDVRVMLPLPSDARIELDACWGARAELTCVVEARSGLSRADAVAAVRSRMSTWEEVDRTPDGVPTRWRHDRDRVGVLIQDDGAGSRWQLTYVADPYGPPPIPAVATPVAVPVAPPAPVAAPPPEPRRERPLRLPRKKDRGRVDRRPGRSSPG